MCALSSEVNVRPNQSLKLTAKAEVVYSPRKNINEFVLLPSRRE
jgi:hypothetical protein